MLRREAVSNTYLGKGIAIPHGTVEDRDLIQKDAIAVLQVRDGVEWNAGERARLVVAIAARSDGHIEILRRLTRLLQDEDRLAVLAATDDRQALSDALNGVAAGAAATAEPAGDFAQSFDWVLDYPTGLHARPATEWAEAARRFPLPHPHPARRRDGGCAQHDFASEPWAEVGRCDHRFGRRAGRGRGARHAEGHDDRAQRPGEGRRGPRRGEAPRDRRGRRLGAALVSARHRGRAGRAGSGHRAHHPDRHRRDGDPRRAGGAGPGGRSASCGLGPDGGTAPQPRRRYRAAAGRIGCGHLPGAGGAAGRSRSHHARLAMAGGRARPRLVLASRL